MKLELLKLDRIPVFFHGDADGCCSCAVVCDWLKQHEKQFQLHPREIDPKVSHVPGFFLDLAKTGPDHVTKDSVVVDHHLPVQLECEYHNPRLQGENWPASYECWRLFGREATAWICAVGCIGDTLPVEKVNSIVRNKWGVIDLQKAADIIDARRSVHGTPSMSQIVELLLESWNNPAAFIENQMLNHDLGTVNQEITMIMGKEPHILDKLVVIEFKSKLEIKSQLANLAKLRWPDRVILVAHRKENEYKISLREKTPLVDFSKILPSILNGLKGQAGGHPVASGGNIKSSDFSEFVRRLRDAL